MSFYYNNYNNYFYTKSIFTIRHRTIRLRAFYSKNNYDRVVVGWAYPEVYERNAWTL